MPEGGDDGYPGLRFAYPGLYASPASRPHMLRMSSPQHLTGVCNTPLQVNENLRRNGRPKDVTPEAECRRDVAVGER